MGADKAFVPFHGRPLIERSLLAASAASEVTIVGGDVERLSAAGLLDGRRWLPDDEPGQGPLGGILTALRQCVAETVVVLPCDLLLVTQHDVADMVQALDASDAHTALPLAAGRVQWACSAWRRDGALPELERAWLAGARSIRDGTRSLRRIHVVCGSTPWRDADTPEELAEANSDQTRSDS